MTDLAAHRVDHAIPRVPVRQCVLSPPHAFRYRLAYDHARMVAVFGLFVRAVLGVYARGARAHGPRGGQTGAVTFVRRFGSAANLHIHAQVLVMDGVFTAADSGEPTFHALPSLHVTTSFMPCLARYVGASCRTCGGTAGSTAAC